MSEHESFPQIRRGQAGRYIQIPSRVSKGPFVGAGGGAISVARLHPSHQRQRSLTCRVASLRGRHGRKVLSQGTLTETKTRLIPRSSCASIPESSRRCCWLLGRLVFVLRHTVRPTVAVTSIRADKAQQTHCLSRPSTKVLFQCISITPFSARSDLSACVVVAKGLVSWRTSLLHSVIMAQALPHNHSYTAKPIA